jgi:gamma-glutamyl hercynylcysteine S-oxide hydrolase
MCRHVARLGSPVTLAELLVAPPYSLQTQAYAPRRQRHGRINADGFGAGWYIRERPEPVRFRRAQPMWSDRSFASVAQVVRSSCVLAAVRSASVGFPVEESCSAPFTEGPFLFSHNGRVDDFAAAAAKLAERAADVPDGHASVDSALLFALAVARWRSGSSLAEGLADTVADVTAVTGGRLNLLATDGDVVAATTYGDTLFTCELPDAVIVASEPYDDDPAWREVPDRSLVTADFASGITVSPLPLETL